MDSSDELAIEPFAELVGREVIELVLKVAPRKVGSRIGKALDHYTKALRLKGLDDEMGAIRLIAAEEELVVAIFEWLKLNAAAMPEHGSFIRRSKNHRVKLAFYPVLSQFNVAIGGILSQGITLDGLEDVLSWHVTPVLREDRVIFRISDAEGKEIITHNPLSIAVSLDGRSNAEVINALFEDLIGRIREQRGMTLREFVTARANYRNQLLYADDAGYLAMGEDLSTLICTIFQPVLRDLLWCLAVLLTNPPGPHSWGLINQFVTLYRRVLAESGVI